MKVDRGKGTFALGLLRRNRTKVGQRLVVVNRANVVAPAIGKFGLALGEEQRVSRGPHGNAAKQTHHGSVDERLQTRARAAGAFAIARSNTCGTPSYAKYRRPTSSAL